MNVWIAFLRGVNVGGHNLLPMKALRSLLIELDCRNVKTYIQSGNVVLQSTENNARQLERDIQSAIETQFSFRPSIMVLTTEQLSRAVRNNPFGGTEIEPGKLQMFFLAEPPECFDDETLESLRGETEQYKLVGNVLYLHAPDGIARSKLAAKVENVLGVPTTARNARTASKVLLLADTCESE